MKQCNRLKEGSCFKCEKSDCRMNTVPQKEGLKTEAEKVADMYLCQINREAKIAERREKDGRKEHLLGKNN